MPDRSPETVDAIPEVVASPDAAVQRGLVPTREAARLLGMSEASVLRQVEALGGKRGARGRWFFEIERLRIVRDTGGARHGASPIALEERDGSRDARVFAALEAGKPVAAIVIEEKVAARVVLALRDTWLEAHRADSRGVVLTCRACNRPSDPRFAFCREHATHATVLTEEQRRTLAGQEIPTAVHCTSCGAVADAGVCEACVAGISVAIEDGVIRVCMGTRVLRELPLPSSLDASAPADGATLPAPAPTSTSDATRELVELARARLRDAQAPFPEDT